MGGPTDQVGSSNNEDAFEDRCLCNDDFEDGCDSSVDHQVVRYQEFVSLFVEKSEETCSGFEVGHIRVSVSAHFDHSQHQTIRDAGVISGLNVCRIINESEPATKP